MTFVSQYPVNISFKSIYHSKACKKICSSTIHTEYLYLEKLSNLAFHFRIGERKHGALCAPNARKNKNKSELRYFAMVWLLFKNKCFIRNTLLVRVCLII